MSTAEKRQEFRVVVEGVALPKEATQRINTAIQRAAASEIAGLDLRGDLHAFMPKREWLGIWIGRLNADQLGRAGIRMNLGR